MNGTVAPAHRSRSRNCSETRRKSAASFVVNNFISPPLMRGKLRAFDGGSFCLEPCYKIGGIIRPLLVLPHVLGAAMPPIEPNVEGRNVVRESYYGAIKCKWVSGYKPLTH